MGHRASDIFSDSYNLEGGVYKPFIACVQIKTANIFMANEIERRYGSRGVHAWSLHPSVIFETGISQHQEGGSSGLHDRMLANDQRLAKFMKIRDRLYLIPGFAKCVNVG